MTIIAEVEDVVGHRTREELIDAGLDRIVSETGSQGETPHMTLSRELQQMRDAGVREFVDDRGTYRLIG